MANHRRCLQDTAGGSHENAVISAEDAFRVVPSTAPFPTVQAMVADMEARRGISEDFELATVLHLNLMLVDAEIMLLDNALREAARELAHAER